MLDWLNDNGATLGAILLGAHGLALLIVNLTPTPKDDEFVAKLYKPIEFLAGLLTKKAKDTGEAKDANKSA